LTIRIAPYAEKLIEKERTTFMKGGDIMSGIIDLHEILHETKSKRECGIVLKLDFERVCDKVNWAFLMECLKLRGFNEKWCGGIKQVVTGGAVSVKLNDQVGPYFTSHKGVRHGDPMSPILFNFVADCLTKMVKKAQSNQLITGLASNIIPNGIAILQYADDTIVCLKNDMVGARNMKLSL
jgi:hypothetical protein